MKSIQKASLLLTIISFASTLLLQAKLDTAQKDYIDYENIWKPINNDINSKKKKSKVKPQKFTADDAFGGNNALGAYNSKDRVATIVNNDTIYTFKITAVDRNNILPVNANDEKIVIVGSYPVINKKKPEMPVTLYLMGTLQTTITKKPTQTTNQIAGADKNTYAPTTFTPAGKFAGNGLVGNYFASSHSATIHDPTGVNTQSYSFKKVQENNNNAFKLNLVKIGTYSPAPRCENGICSHARVLIELYGKLVDKPASNDQAAADQQ